METMQTTKKQIADPSIDWAAAARAFQRYNESKALSPNTLVYYNNRMDSWLSYLQNNGIKSTPTDIKPVIIRDFLTEETAKNSPTTSQHAYCALRSFYSFMQRDGFIANSPLDAVDKPKRRKTIIPTFSLTEIESILATCKMDFTGIRDKAIITLLLDTGIRVSELCGIKVTDIDYVEQTILVLGKGDKERIVPFGNTCKQAMRQYLTRRTEDIDEQLFFVNCYGESLNRHIVLRMVERRCEAAHIENIRCSPHTFRHTFAVTFLRNGGGVFELQKMLGHTTLDQTRRYAEMSNTDVMNAHRVYSPADRLQSQKPTTGRKRIK